MNVNPLSRSFTCAAVGMKDLERFMILVVDRSAAPLGGGSALVIGEGERLQEKLFLSRLWLVVNVNLTVYTSVER